MRTNTKIAAAVDEICRLAGGIFGDPDPETARAIFEKHGLLIVLANPADAFPLYPLALEYIRNHPDKIGAGAQAHNALLRRLKEKQKR